MRLLIVTQKVDEADKNLGFFTTWLTAFAKHADVIVIANEVGTHALGENVRVYSLGKEKRASRFQRFIRYRKLLREHLPTVDGIFFHMCPEYTIAAYPLCKRFGKRSAFWYVHREVSARLWLAEKLVNKIFTASSESFRLGSRKVEVAGHGIDVESLRAREEGVLGVRLLTVGRISPVKDIRTLILGFLELKKSVADAEFNIIGEPITGADKDYERKLREEFGQFVSFRGGVAHAQAFSAYPFNAFVHASQTGAVDKAVLEALAIGTPVFTSSDAFSESIPGIFKFTEGNAADVAEKLKRAFEGGKLVYNKEAREYVAKHHNLPTLILKIISFFA